MTFKVYFKNNCFVTVNCDCVSICPCGESDNDFDILCCRNHYQSIDQDYVDVCVGEFDFADVLRVVEICSDSIELYEKDVTEELRLRCKSSRGVGAGEHRSVSRDNVLMDFGDFFERIFIIVCDIGIAIFGIVFLLLFLDNFCRR